VGADWDGRFVREHIGHCHVFAVPRPSSLEWRDNGGPTLAFKAAVIRCVVIVALAVTVSIVVAMARESGRCNDDDFGGYFADAAHARSTL
jgi:hypothetical protein